MYITQPISNGGDLPHTVSPPPNLWPPIPWVLSLGNCNIRNGRGPGLVQVIQGARIGGFDLINLTETKITYQDYCRNRMGYNAVLTQAIITVAGDAQGGGVLVIRDQPQGWIIESTHFHGTKVVSIEVVTDKRTPLIGRYLPPSTLFHLTDLEEAFTRFCDQDPISLWDPGHKSV